MRCLNVPSGSAEVERSVSAYNAVVTRDRAALSNERIGDFVYIYANGNEARKEHNLKRSREDMEAQKRKKSEREYEYDAETAFKGKKIPKSK